MSSLIWSFLLFVLIFFVTCMILNRVMTQINLSAYSSNRFWRLYFLSKIKSLSFIYVYICFGAIMFQFSKSSADLIGNNIIPYIVSILLSMFISYDFDKRRRNQKKDLSMLESAVIKSTIFNSEKILTKKQYILLEGMKAFKYSGLMTLSLVIFIIFGMSWIEPVFFGIPDIMINLI